MPTLTERLKSLGVKVGTNELQPPPKREFYPVEEIIPGRFIGTGNALTYLIEEDYPRDYIHGQSGLWISNKPSTIAEWAGDLAIAERDPETIVFLDTETSGLAGGTGTFVFLVGAGRYTNKGFHLAQFFMRDPLEEPTLLLALEEYLAPCQTIVSFNGKAFDVPLLNSRYTMQGWKSPFKALAHVDLLHLSRRLWRDRLPSRTLGNIEVQILQATRTDEEIPGWMIPQIYFDYLRDGDARPLKRVVYHNAMDVISLAALLNYTSLLLEEPLNQFPIEFLDVAAVARLLEELSHAEKASLLYEKCLQAKLPEDIFKETLYRLSMLYKRNNNYPAAISLWEQATNLNQLFAFEELAKYYEHQVQNHSLALEWTLQAIRYINSFNVFDAENTQWKNEFEHRLNRLQRKNSTRER